MIGCQSHSCVIQAPKGMANNGPCRCDVDTIHVALVRYKNVAIQAMELIADRLLRERSEMNVGEQFRINQFMGAVGRLRESDDKGITK